jgi:hypothetical protein
VTLHELCRVMGLPGKPDGISGADVERYYREGRIREIAEYCESDLVIPTASGYGMNYSEGVFPLSNLRRAKPGSLTSSRRAATRSRILPISRSRGVSALSLTSSAVCLLRSEVLFVVVGLVRGTFEQVSHPGVPARRCNM